MQADVEAGENMDSSKNDVGRATSPIRRVKPEEVPGIQPVLYRELDHRIAQTRLQHEPLPETFLICHDGDAAGALVYAGKRYDFNITLVAPGFESKGLGAEDGVFVISNGAGVLTNTVDELSLSIDIGGMIDLRRDFTEGKIFAAWYQ